VQNLALFVFPDSEDHGIQAVAHPSDGQKLFRNVGSPIQPIGLGEQLPRSFKPYAAPRIRPKPPALSGIERKAHSDMTVIPLWGLGSQEEEAPAMRSLQESPRRVVAPWQCTTSANLGVLRGFRSKTGRRSHKPPPKSRRPDRVPDCLCYRLFAPAIVRPANESTFRRRHSAEVDQRNAKSPWPKSGAPSVSAYRVEFVQALAECLPLSAPRLRRCE
jgi:hypothetical protein